MGNWECLNSKSSITCNNENDTIHLAKLIKLFERDNLRKSAIEMANLTDKKFDETAKLTIKEDEKPRMIDKINANEFNSEENSITQYQK